MKFFWKASKIQMAESDIHKVDCGADDDRAMKKWLDYFLLSYEYFYLPNFVSKMGLKKCCLPQQLECRIEPTATVTSLKVT